MNLRRLSLLLVIALFATATVAEARVHRVSPGDSIQDAIDAANPGDTILVDPGEYQEDNGTEYGLHITTPNLRLIGKVVKGIGDPGKVRIKHTGGQETGIYAAPAGCQYRDNSCDDVLEDVYIRGFSVIGFPQNGIQTRWVDGFKILGSESINNLNNGIYPTLSANGLVRNNVSYGSLDTSLWVAGSENVRVVGNELFGSPIGFEITVSNNVQAVGNYIHDNTVGVGLFHPNAAGNPQLPVMEDWVFKHNKVHNNNLPNPAPPASFQAGLSPGYGFLLLGVSDTTIRKNDIQGNDSAGLALLGWCTATQLGDPARNCVNSPPEADPSSNNNLVEENRFADNGQSPPPLPLPGVDILYFQTPPPNGPEPGTGNCFRNNRPEDLWIFSSEADGELPTDGC